jgi:glycosyltransferase involved in cell wall biosynthesis
VLRVALDTRPTADPRGIGRYVCCLRDALRATCPPEAELVEAHRRRGADVLHSPWIDGARGADVVTLHDLVPLKRRGEYLRTGLRYKLHYRAVRRATRVIVPTHAVAADARRLLGIEATVIGEAPAPAFWPRDAGAVAQVRAKYRLPEDYLLWVGGLLEPDPRKRVTELAAAPRALPLVLAGAKARWADALPGVLLTGHVSDDELAALYTGARALVFPSDDEGFGLPAVEALACGTPVVAADVPVLREVLGERATFVAADDVAGLLAVAERAQRPAPPPPPWTWDDAARATWAVYAEAASQA